MSALVGRRGWLVASTVLVMMGISFGDETEAPVEIVLRELLVVPSVTRSGRVAVFQDPVEALLAESQFPVPAEGQTLPGTTERWRRIQSNAEGKFSDPALRGGYAYGSVEVPERGSWLLKARGHRHVYVDGVPRGGDVYGLGITELPVVLEAGVHHLLFRSGRGQLQARLVRAPAEIFLDPIDPTLPDVLAEEESDLWCGIQVVNAGTEWRSGVHALVRCGGEERRLILPTLAPCSRRKLAFQVPRPQEIRGSSIDLSIELRVEEQTIDSLVLSLRVRSSAEKHRRTFVSGIDGSVQYYAVTPPVESVGNTAAPALFLSLHGASVEATNQANAYAPKDWGYVVAPTNRRPYGFDWEDWGRIDAMEVLREASALLQPDPRRIYLTGHSMGGHGTWQIGAHYPDRFAAIGPSAGWRDFWDYGGGEPWPEPDPVQAMLRRASNCSRTLQLADNLLQHGIYVLHGDQDDNVPVSEARAMRKVLGESHPNFAYFEQPGAGHWWGNACVDWPPMFEFFRSNISPRPGDLLAVDLLTVDPAINDRCFWLRLETQIQSAMLSRASARIDPAERRIRITTANVHRLALELGLLRKRLPPGESVRVEIDGVESLHGWPSSGLLRLARARQPRARQPRPGQTRSGPSPTVSWHEEPQAPMSSKGPHRSGLFKSAFLNRVVLVVGTQGSAEENRWAYAKARFDAETFAYRGNGSFEIQRDVDFDPAAEPDRNVVLYGHADMNRAWDRVLDEDPGRIAVRVQRGAVRVGDRVLDDPRLALIAIRPRMGSEFASVGIVAGTDLQSSRLTNLLPYFVSGAGFPDWMVISPAMFSEGSGGVLGCGFFDQDWRVGPASTWRAGVSSSQ